MYTEHIVLDQVTLHEFQQMEEFWEKSRKKNSESSYSRVFNPVCTYLMHDDRAEDYATFFYQLLDHPYASEISVNYHGTWERQYKRDISDDNHIQEIAEIAANDRKKHNFVEVKFHKPGTWEGHKAMIGFREFGDILVGYEVSVHHDLSDAFDIRGSADFRYFNGLWVPNRFEEED